MKTPSFIILLLLFSSIQLNSQELKIAGIIFDQETAKPIAFVNIGVRNKNKGTVSNQNGRFSIKLPTQFLNDTLTISHVSYQTVKISVRNVTDLQIRLQPKATELSEITLSTRKKKRKKIGVKSYNRLLWLSTVSKENDIIENAQRIKIPNCKKVMVNRINLFLRKGFTSDSAFLRINFYKNLDNRPGEKIASKHIIQKKQIKPGWLSIDVEEYDIYMDEDFFVGVEFIPDFKNNSRAVYLGAILTKGKGYSRTSSLGTWKKIQGASSINVEVAY